MSQKLGKHTPYFELVDAQGQAGCPICRLVYKATDRYLDSILYEAVLDPDVRTKLKRSRGFCSDHIDILRRKPGRALGIALIYRDIIRTVAEMMDGGRHEGRASLLGTLLGKGQKRPLLAHQLGTDQHCPACAIGEQAEKRNIDLLLAYLGDAKLYTAYAGGEGLCLPHLIRALEGVEDEDTFEHLVRPQARRYRLMLHDLDEFIRKRDHRFRKEKYGEEGDVWLRAMNATVGGAGMGLSAKMGGRRSPVLENERR